MMNWDSKQITFIYNSALNDAGSREGVDNILSTFSFYDDKIKAAAILETVRK